MPYDYEVLKNHISAAHPELLDAFVKGWNNLSPLSQAHWRQRGFIAPKQKVEYKCWLSWTTVQVDELFEPGKDNDSFDISLSKFEKQLAILFHNNMQHAGDLFGFPYMPPLQNKQYSSRTGRNGSSSERHAIAKDVARVVIYTELRKLMTKWKKDIDVHGL